MHHILLHLCFTSKTVEYFTYYNSGLERLIARNEDEYVQLALQLASDISALQNLRMSLRNLMSKSSLCDGTNFTLGLESTYRNMWRRFCKGDVPSLKRLELLQPPIATDDSSNKKSEPVIIVNSKENSDGSVKANGFDSVQPSKLNINSCEENGVIECNRKQD